MRNLLSIQDFISDPESLEDISQSLKIIQSQFITELNLKQQLLKAKEGEINALQSALEQKNRLMEEMNIKIAQLERNNEGNKQMNKKLINEIVRKQQDIEWYKRTYEQRSFLGTIKQKLFKKLF